MTKQIAKPIDSLATKFAALAEQARHRGDRAEANRLLLRAWASYDAVERQTVLSRKDNLDQERKR